MIQLTRLNGNPILLNSDLIKTAETSPDTMLTLINGEKLIVREKLGEVMNRVLAYRASLLSEVALRLESENALLRAGSLSSIDLTDEVGHPPRRLSGEANSDDPNSAR